MKMTGTMIGGMVVKPSPELRSIRRMGLTMRLYSQSTRDMRTLETPEDRSEVPTTVSSLCRTRKGVTLRLTSTLTSIKMVKMLNVAISIQPCRRTQTMKAITNSASRVKEAHARE